MSAAIAKLCRDIALERQAQVMAERSADSDAWLGATNAMNDYLDELSALARQRDHHVSLGHAPAV